MIGTDLQDVTVPLFVGLTLIFTSHALVKYGIKKIPP